jgi:thioesterase domain-containing protein
MAAHYLREIQAVQTEGPYFIGGAGVGGIVALEMAQQLISQRKNIGILVLADTSLHTPVRKKVLSRMAFYLKREGGRYLVRFAENFVHLLYRRMAEIVYPGYGREDRVWEYTQRATDRYTPRPYPDRIVLFMPEKRLGFPDPLARIDEWRRFAAGRLDAHVIPGEHLCMFKEPGVLLMAQYLRTYLEQASARNARNDRMAQPTRPLE